MTSFYPHGQPHPLGEEPTDVCCLLTNDSNGLKVEYKILQPDNISTLSFAPVEAGESKYLGWAHEDRCVFHLKIGPQEFKVK